MEDYEIVEAVEAFWPTAPKNVPLVSRAEGKVSYVLLLTAESLRVYLELRVGVNGGINETVYVFDPSQAIVADRLIVRCLDGGTVGRGAIMPLSELRHRVMSVSRGRKALALELCNDALWSLLDRLDDSPLDPQVLRNIPSTSQSLRRVVQGGLPSHGRKGGGAGGSR